VAEFGSGECRRDGGEKMCSFYMQAARIVVSGAVKVPTHLEERGFVLVRGTHT
jgi:hypothetical protein